MRTTLLTTALTALVVFGSTLTGAQAQTKQGPLKCTADDSAKPADGSYQTVEIRRPKALVDGERSTEMYVQVFLPYSNARLDTNLDDPQVVTIFNCNKPDQIAYVAKITADGDMDVTKIPLPKSTAKGTKIQACTRSSGCITGTFDSFDKPVMLGSQQAAKK